MRQQFAAAERFYTEAYFYFYGVKVFFAAKNASPISA